MVGGGVEGGAPCPGGGGEVVGGTGARWARPRRGRRRRLEVDGTYREADRKSTRLNSSHITRSRMPSSA